MIILASNSVLRKAIMTSSAMPFEVASADVDERKIEDANADHSPQEVVVLLATAKAQAVAKDFPTDLVIAADTFGVLPNGTRLHKAETAKETIRLALQQSGQTIAVNTGVAVAFQGKLRTARSVTYVTYQKFNEAMVRHLFDHNQTAKRRHAALGFYEDAPGFTLVEKFEGSFTGAMGLPMELVRQLITEVGYDEV